MTLEPNPKVEGDMTFKVENKAPDAILSVGRYMITPCIYAVFIRVTCYMIYTIHHPHGPQYTPGISVNMHCVINLTSISASSILN